MNNMPGIGQKKTNIKVDNRCLEKWFTPLTFSNKRCHLTPISIAIIKRLKIRYASENVKKKVFYSAHENAS